MAMLRCLVFSDFLSGLVLSFSAGFSVSLLSRGKGLSPSCKGGGEVCDKLEVGLFVDV